MKTETLEFHLPEDLIPAAPPAGVPRDHARLAVLDRAAGRVDHRRFDDLGDYLRPGDALIIDDSRVMQDQLAGEADGGPMTLTLCGRRPEGWLVLADPAELAAPGVVIRAAGGAIRATLDEPWPGTAMWRARGDHEGDLPGLLEQHGARYSPQLRALDDRRQAYQNVYASRPGSLEVPSAGLHFTPGLLARLRDEVGVAIVPITLHVGPTEYTAYNHIASERVEDHRVVAEWYEIPEGSADAIAATRRRSGRVVAVGTTAVRTLESAAAAGGMVRPGAGWSDLYIRPGHEFRAVDAMLTNLHQPRSSHLAMVSAFAGADFTMRAYRDLVAVGYRFDVFGDSMLLT